MPDREPRRQSCGPARDKLHVAIEDRAGAPSFAHRQILAALTTAPAAQFGDADRLGKIAVGFDADLAVVRGDPSRDVGVLAAVVYTVRDGKLIYRSGASLKQ